MRTGPSRADVPCKRVRGLSRGLAVLKALNQSPGGSANLTELARASGIHRTTVRRLLETLRDEGLVQHHDDDGRYWLTSEVKRLSDGLADDPWVIQAAGLMQAAVPRLIWPCDLCTADAGFMLVRASTHRFSALSQHRSMLGERLPMLVTAAGRAYLAACNETERAAHLGLLRLRTDRWGDLAREPGYVERILQDTRERRHASNHGEWQREAAFAAVAVPVRASRRLLGTINLIFPKSVLTDADIDARFVPALRRLAQEIGRASAPLVRAAGASRA